MSAVLQACEEFTGEECLTSDAEPLPEEWALVGDIVGVVYSARGHNYMHEIKAGELLAAPGFLLIDSPEIRLTARGLVGSDEV